MILDRSWYVLTFQRLWKKLFSLKLSHNAHTLSALKSIKLGLKKENRQRFMLAGCSMKSMVTKRGNSTCWSIYRKPTTRLIEKYCGIFLIKGAKMTTRRLLLSWWCSFIANQRYKLESTRLMQRWDCHKVLCSHLCYLTSTLRKRSNRHGNWMMWGQEVIC